MVNNAGHYVFRPILTYSSGLLSFLYISDINYLIWQKYSHNFDICQTRQMSLIDTFIESILKSVFMLFSSTSRFGPNSKVVKIVIFDNRQHFEGPFDRRQDQILFQFCKVITSRTISYHYDDHQPLQPYMLWYELLPLFRKCQNIDICQKN